MRSPDQRQLAQPRAGRHFEDELQLRYLAPGAFTVLPPDNRLPPDPPHAPEPYRLTTTQRRHKHQSFAILGEVDSNRPSSRSPSPSGRVSPFRGRGFNPAGSRHVSPNPSPPPPEDARLTPTNLSPRHASKIPQLKRRGSNNFGEKVYHYDVSPTKRKISNKLSTSLTNLESGNNINKLQPTTPRRTAYSKAPAFQTLSPIIGSSPEPSQSLSSPPSRIPKSRSTPPSRKQSPNRKPSPNRTTSSVSGKPPLSRTSVSRNPSRSQSRNPSRTQSRNTSREPSPTKNPTSPTRTPSQKYKNVQAKVNTFNKPKVLPKPQVLSEQSEDSDSARDIKYNKKPFNRKESLNRLRTNNSKSSILSKTGNFTNNNNYNSTSDSSTSVSTVTKNFTKNIINSASSNVNQTNDNETNINNSVSDSNTTKSVHNQNNNSGEIKDKSKELSALAGNSSIPKLSNTNSNSNATPTTNSNLPSENKTSAPTSSNESSKKSEERKVEKDVGLVDMLPSTTTVVSSTTTTVTQPLKIEANIPPARQYDKTVSPMVDGRVLSATSVSNAINKMNDTVLDTQTLMKDHGFSKLSPSTNAGISATNEVSKTSNNPALDTKNATTALPQVEPLPKTVENKIVNNNHTNHVGHVMSSKALELEVQKNFNKLITPEHNLNLTPNEKVKESRTVIASDVQPIRINVREKPSEIEVQSGNVRLPSSISNGLSERPGLPPSQQSPPNEPEKEPPPKNGCARFFKNCKKKMACDCCKRKQENEKKGQEKTTGCFSCLKKQEEPPAKIKVENETDNKPKLLDRLKCCGKQKVADSSCFPLGKRKESWADRADSILSNATIESPKAKCSKDCCKYFLGALCCGLCFKKAVVEEPVRKPSVMSKKKSLTPTTLPPPEDTRPKIDMSLVEHSSVMKGAIPVLPVCLAWFCLVMNCIAPGTGTVFSGMFCLCLGIPRFSQKDGPKPRIGSFLINIIIGVGQFFTVLFCLVGWGWSIWWGVIMLKVAKKHRKLKHLEKMEEQTFQPGNNAKTRDPERNK